MQVREKDKAAFRDLAAVLADSYEGISRKQIFNILVQYEGNFDRTVEDLNKMKAALDEEHKKIIAEEETKQAKAIGLDCLPKFEGEKDSDCQVTKKKDLFQDNLQIVPKKEEFQKNCSSEFPSH